MVSQRVLVCGVCLFVSLGVGCSSCQDDVREDPWSIDDRSDQSVDMKDMAVDLSSDMPTDMATDVSNDMVDAGMDLSGDMDMPAERMSQVMASVHLGRHPYRNYNVILPTSDMNAQEVLVGHPKDGEPCIRYTYLVLRAGSYVYDVLNNNRGYKGEPACPHMMYRRGGPRFEQRTGDSQVFDASPDSIALSAQGDLFAGLTSSGIIHVLDPETLAIRRTITLPGDDFENTTYDFVKQMVIAGDHLHVLVSRKEFSALYTIDTKTYEVVDRDPNVEGVQRLNLSLVRARQMALSPNAQWLAVQFDGTISDGENSGIQIFDAKTLNLNHTIARVGFEPEFGHVVFKDDQSLMASRRGPNVDGNSSIEIKTFNVNTGMEDGTLNLVNPGFYLRNAFLYSAEDNRLWVQGWKSGPQDRYFIARYRLDGQREAQWLVSQFITKVLLLPSQ